MELDWVVGQLLKKLDELGIANNTIVVFTSDNGAESSRGRTAVPSPFAVKGYRVERPNPGALRGAMARRDQASHDHQRHCLP